VDFGSVAAATVVGNSEYVRWSHASFASSYDCGLQNISFLTGECKKITPIWLSGPTRPPPCGLADAKVHDGNRACIMLCCTTAGG
jgi:hypothetical protein